MSPSDWALGSCVPTRAGFGSGVVEVGEKESRVVVVCADTTGSVQVKDFAKRWPERFINVGIAEQNMITVAAGLSLTGFVPFAVTYGIFAAGRPWDQIRTSICYGNLNVKIAGSHGGIITGPDGPTHQILEEMAIMRCIPRMTVIVPCDAWESKKAVIALLSHEGPAYLRLGREAIPIVTTPDTPFQIGKANVMREGKDIAVVACGVMVSEALSAAEKLAQKGIQARVVNMHTIKPLDHEILRACAQECGAIVTAEEHQINGGLGSAVAESVVQSAPVPIEMVAIQDAFGESGNAAELMKLFHIKDDDIILAVERALSRKKRAS